MAAGAPYQRATRAGRASLEHNPLRGGGARGRPQNIELSPRVTAIFADNLLLVTGILHVLREKKISCPDQIEVMSSDDAAWLDVFQPSISTVVQPSYDLGRTAAELLLKRFRHPNAKFRKLLLQPSLKIRP